MIIVHGQKGFFRQIGEIVRNVAVEAGIIGMLASSVGSYKKGKYMSEMSTA